jgi:short-subunit dehydrogenase
MNSEAFTVITGASQGLGKAFAEECALGGRNLVLAALPDTGLVEVARWIERVHGVRVHALEVDLTSDDGPACLVRFVEERGLAVDALVNNAGVGFNGRFGESEPDHNETTIRLNMLALVALTRLLLPALHRHGRAHVLNIASLAAFFPMPWLPVYSSSKSFVLAFSLALREELRGTGVSVSVVCPNGIRTNRGVRELIAKQGLAGRLTCQYPEQVARAALAGMLAGRAVIVPGVVNRLLRFASGLVPRSIAMSVITRRWNAEALRAGSGELRPAGERRPVPKVGARFAGRFTGGMLPWRRAVARV